MEITYNQHVGIFKNAVPKEWCEGLIDLFNSNPKYHIDRYTQENIPSNIKADNHLALDVDITPFFKPFAQHFWDSIYPKYQSKYTPDTELIPYPLHISGFKIQKTLPTEGYHVWHCEYNFMYTNRVMAYAVYLNDVEEGGETEFLHQSLRLKSTQGTLVLWPAGYTHIHRGNPPLSGEKYIVTGWIEYDHKTANSHKDE
jgi:hypothetical protein